MQHESQKDGPDLVELARRPGDITESDYMKMQNMRVSLA
mgnify:FL=1